MMEPRTLISLLIVVAAGVASTFVHDAFVYKFVNGIVTKIPAVGSSLAVSNADGTKPTLFGKLLHGLVAGLLALMLLKLLGAAL